MALLPRLHTEQVTLTKRRRMIALAVAGASDLAQLVFAPAFAEGAGSPLDVALDAATAAVILFIVGFHWRLAIALAAELVPGVDLFPTWTALVLSLPARGPNELPASPPASATSVTAAPEKTPVKAPRAS